MRLRNANLSVGSDHIQGRLQRNNPKGGIQSAEPLDLDHYLLHPEAGTLGNAVHVLFGSPEAYPQMLDRMAHAQSEILLESYIFADDSTGKTFAEMLAQKARDGIRVHLLIDGFGSFGFPESRQRELRAAGVQLAVFHPVRPWRPRWSWSVRDHRKLLVVDGTVAFIGGLNISDEDAAGRPERRAWHDVHAQIQGPATAELRRNSSGLAPRDRREYRFPCPTPSCPQRLLAMHLSSRSVGGYRERRRIQKHYQYALRRAQSTVRVMFGYFVPDRGWLRLLGNTARRGIDVRVMFPAHSDVPALQWAARATYGRLLRAGVQVFEWEPSMLHAKALAVDGVVCAIGSYNLDQRSLLVNWELSVLVAGGSAARCIEQRFESDEQNCTKLDLSTWSKRGLLQRIAEWFFYTLRHWL
jgi:cardiolipin synthase